MQWYGRRYGRKLSVRRLELLKTLLPKVGFNFETLQTNIEPLIDRLIGKHEVWLEIGFGTGEHLAEMAVRYPSVFFVGCEPFINGVAALLSKIDDQALDNILIYSDDARPFLDILPEQSISKVFLLFADPWPKAKHKKRRFVNNKNLDRIARILKDEGEFRFSSDHKDYAIWTHEHLQNHADFHCFNDLNFDWLSVPKDWIVTRYAEKAQANGVKPIHLQFQRVIRDIQ